MLLKKILIYSQFSTYKKFTLIEGDALEFLPQNYKLLADGYKLIANIPYYITGAILEYYLSHKHQPLQMVVLVQKEVAERIVARDGKESILSIAVKVYGDPKIVYRVKRGSFNPIPNVDSAVLAISNISRKNFTDLTHEKDFFAIVKAGFSHKRKFLLSNLKEKLPTIGWQELFIKNSINEKIRAENMSLQNWLTISRC